MRLVRPFYTLSFVLIAIAYGISNNRGGNWDWLMVFPALLLAWTAVRHLRQRHTTLTIGGNKLRYEAGVMSKTARSMELSKVQDVRVQQSLSQRLLSIGDLYVETAGESGGISMRNVDNPHGVADYILESARK